MEWFQVYVNDLSTRALSAADDAAVGAWFRLLGNCYRLENGGCYEHCSKHSLRQWMSIAGVDREAVDKVVAAGLASWEEDSLRVHGYDIAQQQKATERKEKGREMANARWSHAASNAASNAVGNTEERRGKEIKEEEKKEDLCPAGGPAGRAGVGEGAPRLKLVEDSKPEAEKAKKPGKTYSDSFLRFWAAWPKRVKKEGAWQVWRTKRCEQDLDAILTALAWQVKSAEWTKDGGQYIPDPPKYLRGELWEDDPSVYAHKGARDVRVGHYCAEDADHSRVGDLLP
jgi:hypothetical protein